VPVANRSITRTDLRQAVVWQGLREAVDLLGLRGPSDDGRLTVLDAGGGSGGFAVPLAEHGHDVTVVDPSPDSLAALGRRAAERGVAGRVHGRQGDLSNLLDIVEPGGAHLVLCHNVLEVVDDPAAALSKAVAALRPGGLLSVLAANRVAAVFARAVAGRFDDAAALLAGPPAAGHDGPGRRFGAARLGGLVTDAGADIVATHGVRVFADLVPDSLADADPAAMEALLRLEISASRRRPYLDVATQIHVLAARRGPV
jgi:S-adenosylmethionine-dependent methyltransferase